MENERKPEPSPSKLPLPLAKALKWLSDYLWLVIIVLGAAALAFVAMPLVKTKIDGEKTELWLADLLFSGAYKFNWLLLITLIFVLVAAVLPAFHRFGKNFLIGSMLLFIIAGLMLFLSPSFFEFIQYGLDAMPGDTSLQLGSIYGGSMCFVAALLALDASYQKDQFDVRDLVEIGVLIAMAVALNFGPKIQVGATGGSINFQLVPLFVIVLRHGPTKGFFAAGIVFGFITCLTDGWGLFSYPFDYLVGFGSVAALGFFNSLILPAGQSKVTFKGELFLVIGILLATAIRFVGSTVSSIVIWDRSFAGALVYNVWYIIPTGIISAIAMALLYKPILILNVYFRTTPIKGA